MIVLVSAKSPKFIDQDGRGIDLLATFEHCGEVGFFASIDDVEPHGREIYVRALAGQFGPVAEFIPPTSAEIAARDNPPLRASKMAQAVDQATHWDMMGDTTQAAAWRSYYQQVYALGQTAYWPLVVQWPVAPELAA